MNITVITLTRNEKIMLPFFLAHYERFADKIIVYDGGSTDGTREIIQAHPLCELREHDTGGKIDDAANCHLKNTAYRTVNADWVIIVDCDELLYHPNIRDLLEDYTRRGITFPQVAGYQMVGDKIPKRGTQLAEQIRLGVRDPFWDKHVIFNPAQVAVNYLPGAHQCDPIGNVYRSPFYELKLLHYKWLSRGFVQGKCDSLRMADANHANGWGYEFWNGQLVESKSIWVDKYEALKAQRQMVI